MEIRMTTPVYKNPFNSIEDRVNDLLDKMTLEDKILQLTSIWISFDPEKGEMKPSIIGGNLGEDTDKIDIGYYPKTGIGQITRPFGSRPIDPVKSR